MAPRGVIAAALLCVCCWLSHLELISSAVLDWQYGLCNTGQFASNSTFASNLNTVNGLLYQRSSASLFGNATRISNPNSTSDNCYGFFQCRGDVSLADCSTCIFSIINSASCGSAMGSRIMLEGCFLRYESYDFFLQSDHAFITNKCSTNSSTATSSYRRNLAAVLKATAQAASLAPRRFNSSSLGSGDDTAYGLAECLTYLTPSECSTCLQVSDYSVLCPNAVTGATFYSTCYYLYSNVSFNSSLKNTAPTPGTPASPPLRPPAPSPTRSSISPVGSATSTQENSQTGSKRLAIVGGVIGGILIVVLLTLLLFCGVRRRRRGSRQAYEIPKDGISVLENIRDYNATKFSYTELQKATNNFSLEKKLGEGGFGPVYKGSLPSGKGVAVKMLSLKSRQGTQQFMNEVSLITTVQHRNLVELLGYCIGESKRILVYEYLPNRSLDVHLFGEAAETIFLNWKTRFNIIIGIARGLRYLHEDSHVKIVHRDIKSSNILLDDNLNPKIADFGLAKFFENEVTHLTTKVAGTMGYLSPEYAIGGHLSEKVDVYSFGLIALEILSGRRIMDDRLEPEKQSLLEWTWTSYEKKQQLGLLDPKLVGEPIDPGEVIRLVHVALLCTQTRARSRPVMSKVFAMLCSESEILESPTKPLLIDMEDNAQRPAGAGPSSSSSNSDLQHGITSNANLRTYRAAGNE